jgi:hypothetical protein
MNFEEIGFGSVAELRNEKKKSDVKPIYIEPDKAKVDDYYKEIKCKNNEYIQHTPHKSNERQILYITGASGSGKSYYVNKYGNEYRKKFKNNPIYLFSSVQDDTSLKIPDLKRVKLDEGFLNAELTASDFKDSLVIFDDTDVINNKHILKKVNLILDTILQTGRHHGTSVIYTSHTACNGNQTKVILNEAHSVTIYPSGLGGRSSKYLLNQYFGLEKEQIRKIKRLPSRWTTIVKSYPMIVLYEKGAYILNTEDD